MSIATRWPISNKGEDDEILAQDRSRACAAGTGDILREVGNLLVSAEQLPVVDGPMVLRTMFMRGIEGSVGLECW
jgi:hypothetical protein